MSEGEYVNSLVSEYAAVLRRSLSKYSQSQRDESGIIEELVSSADWSSSGARELLKLADSYGAFMLRNALAIAVVLGKEDGSQGF